MSEIARLREQIELECMAMRRALSEYASVSSHDVINQKYNALGKYKTELEHYIGREEANNIVLETYAKVVG